MSEPRSFASLTPSLLARKGAARPAMRRFHEIAAQQSAEEDLGWNDMGEGHAADRAATGAPAGTGSVVSLSGAVPQPVVPEVVRQQEAIGRSISAKAGARRATLVSGRRAAFTLRLDADRHLRLRLACTIDGRSAQQIVTEALDRLLADKPELESLAAQVRKSG